MERPGFLRFTSCALALIAIVLAAGIAYPFFNLKPDTIGRFSDKLSYRLTTHQVLSDYAATSLLWAFAAALAMIALLSLRSIAASRRRRALTGGIATGVATVAAVSDNLSRYVFGATWAPFEPLIAYAVPHLPGMIAIALLGGALAGRLAAGPPEPTA